MHAKQQTKHHVLHKEMRRKKTSYPIHRHNGFSLATSIKKQKAPATFNTVARALLVKANNQ